MGKLRTKPALFMMIGIPGSGKSVMAENIKKSWNAIIHSSDKIREELNVGNEKEENQRVFQLLHKRVKEDLLAGNNVIYDATNLNRKKRINFFNEIDKSVNCLKYGVLMVTPYEKCCKQNEERNTVVPYCTMQRMLHSFEVPCMQEGFDNILVIYGDNYEYDGECVNKLMSQCKNFNQENTHHDLSLGDHMERTYDSVCGLSDKDEVRFAALIHDIGKLYTKTFVNFKGVEDGEAHYYNHDKVGAYYSLFVNSKDWNNGEELDKLYVALLIELHMRPYLSWAQSKRTLTKDTLLFGQAVIDDVMKIHKADTLTHKLE